VGKDGIVSHVELSVKTSTDFRAFIKKLAIKITADGIEAVGEPVQVQSGDINLEEHKFVLPAKTTQGKTFADIDEKSAQELEEKKATEKKSSENKSEGSLQLSLVQKTDAEITQSDAREGKFFNNISTSFEMLNRGDTKLVITKMKAEYKRGNDWVDCDTCVRGTRQRAWVYNWDRSDSSLTVNPKSPEMIALCGGISVTAKQVNTYRRLHQSLPDPLIIRFTFIEVNGGSINICVTAHNPPLVLPTKTSVLAKRSSWSSSNEVRVDIGFLQCDDFETQNRIYAEFSRVDGGSYGRVFYYTSNCGASSASIYEHALKKLAYTAASEGKTEVIIEQISRPEEAGQSATTYLLVDQKLRLGYAFRTVLVTNTGRAEEAFLLFPPARKS